MVSHPLMREREDCTTLNGTTFRQKDHWSVFLCKTSQPSLPVDASTTTDVGKRGRRWVWFFRSSHNLIVVEVSQCELSSYIWPRHRNKQKQDGARLWWIIENVIEWISSLPCSQSHWKLLIALKINVTHLVLYTKQKYTKIQMQFFMASVLR